MLVRLSISNFLLIEHLELDLHPGLNIITGETGAGKSILMDALGLLNGERADSKSLRNPEKKCCVEAWFQGNNVSLTAAFLSAGIEPESENILRREILPGGKSRAFINDSPVTLETMRHLSMLLFDIHGQQDSQLLGNTEVQFQVLDVLAGTTGPFSLYQNAFKGWKAALKNLEHLRSRNSQNAAELDYKSFLLHELTEAGLKEGEQEEIEGRLSLMKNSGDILARLQQAAETLEGRQDLLGSLKSISGNLARVSSFSPELESLSERMNSAWLELKDLTSEIRELESRMDFDPRKLETDEERLSRLYSLQKKHRTNSVTELIVLRKELEVFVHEFGFQDTAVEKLEEEVQLLETEAIKMAALLHVARSSGTEAIAQELMSMMTEMAMPKAQFAFQLEEQPGIGPFGKANIRYLFSANPGLAMSDLKNAASGGEFSRLMLAFKCLMAAKTEMPSLIFDEIDTGISGEVAMRVGKLIRQMAERHQVLVITHSAQMASRAQAHWKVEKIQEADSTETRVRLLSPEESALEIATIISGHEPGKAALEAAKELLKA